MDRRTAIGAVAMAAGAGLGGCAFSGNPVDPAADNLSVVFGFIDMGAAPSNLKWVFLKGYGAGASSYRAGVEDNMFFHVGVEPGAYQVERFGGDRSLVPIFGQPYEYSWGTQGRNGSAVRIERPDVYFLGSYRTCDRRPASSKARSSGWRRWAVRLSAKAGRNCSGSWNPTRR